ncbi:hypothetical protein CPB86DRAFT_378750 [Serendipita vermifera]|nr:hypothetical protein CPB86DRAFT_378750 [Serendipita vermifera]
MMNTVPLHSTWNNFIRQGALDHLYLESSQYVLGDDMGPTLWFDSNNLPSQSGYIPDNQHQILDPLCSLTQASESAPFIDPGLPVHYHESSPYVRGLRDNSLDESSSTPSTASSSPSNHGVSLYREDINCTSTLVSQATDQNKRVGNLACRPCSKPFSIHAAAGAYTFVHLNVKPFPCGGLCGADDCTKMYATKDLLRRHCTPIAKRTVVCPICHQLRSKQNIARHKCSCAPSTVGVNQQRHVYSYL